MGAHWSGPPRVRLTDRGEKVAGWIAPVVIVGAMALADLLCWLCTGPVK